MRVFISYSHDDEPHRQAVVDLAQELRRAGIDARIDRFEPDPDIGWAQWMREQVRLADRILVVPSETWLRRFEGRERPDVGKGVRWEGMILTDKLYHGKRTDQPVRAILVGNAQERFIPDVIGTHTFYRGAEDFLRFVRGEAAVAPVALGEATVYAVEPFQAARSAREELQRFLLARFKPLELDQLLAWQQGGEELRQSLPSPGRVAPREYVHELLEVLIGRGELAHRWLWERFRSERRNFVEEINAMQAMWG